MRTFCGSYEQKKYTTDEDAGLTYPCLGCQKHLEVCVEGQHRMICYASEKLLKRSLTHTDKLRAEPVQALQAVLFWQRLQQQHKKSSS